jgi:hypothetical protein
MVAKVVVGLEYVDMPIRITSRLRGLLLLLACVAAVPAQKGSDFTLALPNHNGQIRWTAAGFKPIEYSAKSNGNEIGVRGQDESHHLTFLGFLFLFSDQAPLTSSKCRDGVINPARKSNPLLKIVGMSESPPGVRPSN